MSLAWPVSPFYPVPSSGLRELGASAAELRAATWEVSDQQAELVAALSAATELQDGPGGLQKTCC